MSKRHDFYGPIHKGLRLGAARLLIRLGAADWRDAAAAHALLDALALHLALSKEHLEHEDAEILPALRVHAPWLAATLDHDHVEHYETFAALDAAIAAVRAAAPQACADAAHALYLRYSRYFGEDLAHMEREENEAMPLFQALFSDAELMGMETRIIAAIAPARLHAYYQLMLAGMAPAERAAFLRYVRDTAPPEAYAQLLHQEARAALSPVEFALLREELSDAA